MYSSIAATPARIASLSSATEISSPPSRVDSACRRSLILRAHWATALLLCSLAVPFGAVAQSAANTPASATALQSSQKPVATAHKIPRVTTTVVVQAKTANDYLPDTVNVGTLDGLPLKDAPVSATVVWTRSRVPSLSRFEVSVSAL